MDSKNKDFQLGYADGLQALPVNACGAFVDENYYNGYIFGRFGENFVMPCWMNSDQVQAAIRLYLRNPDGSRTFSEFLERIQNYGDYCGLGWCGMFIGIEKDGYTHS